MGATVLVVEDEVMIADDIQRTLIRLGYSVPATAASHRAALQAAREHRPALALMDIKLKGAIDGIETAKCFTRDLDIPVIYVTSHSDDATLARAMEAHPYGYLVKPFNDRELRTAVEVALHKHAVEVELARRERWFSTTLESIGEGVLATDEKEKVTFINPIASKLTGWTRDEAVGRALDDVLRLYDATDAPSHPAKEALRGARVASTEPGNALVSKGGKRVSVDDNAAPIVDRDGALLGAVVVLRDATLRRALEKRLRHSEKLAALGALSAELAHEINNPLAYVVANVSFAFELLTELRDAPGELDLVSKLERLRSALADAQEGADRVTAIVRELKKFVRLEDASRHALDVRTVLESACKLTEGAIRKRAQFVRELGAVPNVVANETLLAQVFVNLLSNAAQALGEGDPERHTVRVETDTDEAGRARIRVRDSGTGIPDDVLPHIFDAFFTTKATGSGLGLGICHNIIESFGGSIRVETSERGSMFEIVLPGADELAKRSSVPVQIVRKGRRGKILVIDDEPAVGRALRTVLAGQHEVVLADGGASALEVLKQRHDFDLIYCDLMMPGVSGIDVYEAIRETRPHLTPRMIFITGGVFSERTAKFLESVKNLQVEKPFSVDALRKLTAKRIAELDAARDEELS